MSDKEKKNKDQKDDKKGFPGQKKGTGGNKKRKKKDNYRQGGKEDKDKDIPPYKGVNDIKWRTEDETMTKLVASLPFGFPAGLPQRMNVGTRTLTYEIPGILAVPVLLTAGVAADYNSPCNLAFRKIYSYVRHANSGSKNYEAADMGLYFMSIGQVLGLLSWLQRLVRVIGMYSATNRYLPTSLLKMMGVDADDAIAHYADYSYLVAWLGRAVGALAFPKMNYFEACYEAFQYIFKDSDSPKEQFYMLIPKEIGQYDPTYNTNGGGLHLSGSSFTYPMAQPNTTSPMNYTFIYNLIHERMDVLLSDEDCGIISGDILKAFGESGVWKPAAFGNDYDVLKHDQEFLQQIHNLTTINPNALTVNGYAQNPGSTGTAPFVINDMTAGTGETSNVNIGQLLHIDAFSREPDAKEVVNCTVLNPQFELVGTGSATYGISPSTMAYDLFLPYSPFILAGVAGTPLQINKFSKLSSHTNYTTCGVTDLLLTAFDWHPLYYSYNTGANVMYIIGDVQNYRAFSIDVARRIHENSTLNLFNFKDNNFVKQ